MPRKHHTSFLERSRTTLQTVCEKKVEVWELHHINNDAIMSAWAKHFRQHYCRDSDIDSLRKGTGKSRQDYLNTIKFPDKKQKPGPSIRAGNFAEILVADFLEFIHGYEVLGRLTRYSNKTIRNESTKGNDIIGFRFVNGANPDPKDELAFFEAKAKFTGNSTSAQNRLQDAIKGSAKDKLRLGESLNAMKQRFIEQNMAKEAEKVQRFQNVADNPYTTNYGAVALVCNSNYSEPIATSANTSSHPFNDNLRLVIIKGENMMALVHELYKRAADEAR